MDAAGTILTTFSVGSDYLNNKYKYITDTFIPPENTETLRVVFRTTRGRYSLNAAQFDTFSLTANLPQQLPFGNGSDPWPIPGQIQVENFDRGGQDASYYDLTPSNDGGEYRLLEDVDIDASLDSDGVFDVTSIQAGEWLEYTTIVAETGNYRLGMRFASLENGGIVRVLVDGTETISALHLDSTGSWNSYSTVYEPSIYLESGTRVIRLEIVSGEFLLNWLNFTRLYPFYEYIEKYPSLSAIESLPQADPDFDGMPNILEQWLARDPTIQDQGSNLPYSWADGELFHYAFTFDSTVEGSTLLYETSTDLKTWTPQPLLPSWVTEEGHLRHVDVALDTELLPTKQFHRIRAEIEFEAPWAKHPGPIAITPEEWLWAGPYRKADLFDVADPDSVEISVVGGDPSWLTIRDFGHQFRIRGTPPIDQESQTVTLRATSGAQSGDIVILLIAPTP